jgi:hypothetical protein
MRIPSLKRNKLTALLGGLYKFIFESCMILRLTCKTAQRFSIRLAVAFSFLGNAPSLAQVWIGAESGVWGDATNWTGTVVPGENFGSADFIPGAVVFLSGPFREEVERGVVSLGGQTFSIGTLVISGEKGVKLENGTLRFDNPAAPLLFVRDGGLVLGSGLTLDIGNNGGRPLLVAILAGNLEITDPSFVLGDLTIFGGDELVIGGETVTTNSTGFVLDRGLISYSVIPNPNDSQVQVLRAPSQIIGGVAANIAVASTLVNSMVNHPVARFFDRLHTGRPDKCAVGGWTRLFGGAAGTIANTSSASLSMRSRMRMSYTGLQSGVDFGCYQDFISGWDLAGGLDFGTTLLESRQHTSALDRNGMPARLSPSQITSTLEQNYLGINIALMRQNWVADLRLLAESSKFVFNLPLGGDLVNVAYNARSTNVSGSLRYFWNFDHDITLTSMVGLSLSRSRGGRLNFGDTPASILDVHPHSIKMVLGGVTLAQTRTSGAEDSMTTRFLTMNMYSDISVARLSTFTSGRGGAPMTLSMGSFGTVGEVSLGLTHTRRLRGNSAGAANKLNASIQFDAKMGVGLKALGLSARVKLFF